MGEATKISWCDATFNPWIGCTKVSLGCEFCYAKTLMDDRYGRVKWGPKGERSRTSDANWRKPLKWNRDAAKAGRQLLVFCASLADVFDDHPTIDPKWRSDLWALTQATPNLRWLLLSKRPENWPVYLPAVEPEAMPNIWLGVTIEDQTAADVRGPALQVAADFGWPTFVSYEPAIGPVDWSPFLEGHAARCYIVGQESGHGRRPFDEDWVRALRDGCQHHSAGLIYKQRIDNGRKVESPELDGRRWTEWPA